MKHLRRFNESVNSSIIDNVIEYLNNNLVISMTRNTVSTTESFSFICDDHIICIYMLYFDMVKYVPPNNVNDDEITSKVFISIDNVMEPTLTTEQNTNLIKSTIKCCYWNRNLLFNSIHKYFKKGKDLIDKSEFIDRLIEFDVIKGNYVDILSLSNFFEFYTGKRFFRYKSNMITLLKKFKLPIIEY